MQRNTLRGVLDGLRVVELSAFVAAPLGGMTLAQLGAEVIRVDPLGGGLDRHRWPLTSEGESLYWAGLNKGKRSMALDTGSHTGRDLVKRLITAPGADAGIFLTNVSPRWLSYDELQTLRPDLIMIRLTGSPDGSPAVDYTINASAGYPIVTGAPADLINHVLPAWDLIAGHMVATSVLAAERWRSRRGEGNLVDLSLADIAFSTIGHLGHVAEVAVNDEDRPAFGNYVYGSYGKDFTTGDGQRIMLVAMTPRQWSALVAATDTADEMAAIESELSVDLNDEGNRFKVRERISTALEPWFAGHSLVEVAAIMNGHRVCWGPYRSFRGLVEDDPRLKPDDNTIWANVYQPGIGLYPMPASPIRLSHVAHLPPQPAPELGGDTKNVLADVLGLRSSRIALLRREGVI